MLWDSSSSAPIHENEYDEDYHLFIHLLTRQLVTSITAAVLLEDEMRQARIAAEQGTMDRTLLLRRLAIQTHEALKTENRFQHIEYMALVCMFHINLAGCLVYANEHGTISPNNHGVYQMLW